MAFLPDFEIPQRKAINLNAGSGRAEKEFKQLAKVIF